MKISLCPQRMDAALTIYRTGPSALSINGAGINLSALPDGATLPASAVDSDWIVGDVTRTAGELHLTILLPIGADAPEAARFPADIVDPPIGRVSLPTDQEA
ncbi:hypothetical protein SAMN05892877_105349 [Rhizobium subbaraonis]|uniref:Uncharacterized protein n=1 Tax=Rhizobium subbaraonis TaxID=908946 RepID=A0A285UAY5_9HYPH|nr:hypothetical protein [Rhizobium subbaraonis]SOC38959.1 hypothetical protein SAMN05892877_105349 [Rhizobium subbaraonis]